MIAVAEYSPGYTLTCKGTAARRSISWIGPNGLALRSCKILALPAIATKCLFLGGLSKVRLRNPVVAEASGWCKSLPAHRLVCFACSRRQVALADRRWQKTDRMRFRRIGGFFGSSRNFGSFCWAGSRSFGNGSGGYGGIGRIVPLDTRVGLELSKGSLVFLNKRNDGPTLKGFPVV